MYQVLTFQIPISYSVGTEMLFQWQTLICLCISSDIEI